MPAPTWSQLTTLSSNANGLIPESMEERILSVMAILASGKAPDGTVVSVGGALGGITQVTGADPTGVADSTSFMQTALSTAAKSGVTTPVTLQGGIVLLSPGVYNIASAPLILCPGVRFIGCGDGNTQLKT